MPTDARTRLGKIFVSYSSKDKPFVARLVSTLEKRGYDIWLDERELVAGDPLPQKLGKAIASSKVVIVVISRHSKGSKWSQYEINRATERMVKGQCRLIPALLGDVEPPPEIGGLVYADLRKSFKHGLSSVLKTLEHEESRYPECLSFWSQIGSLLKEEFGSLGGGSIVGEYRSQDYRFVSLGQDMDVGYEIVSAYVNEGPLSARWWEEFTETIAEIGIPYFLLITERPVGYGMNYVFEEKKERIMRFSVDCHYFGVDHIDIIIIDMSALEDGDTWRDVIKRGRGLLEKHIAEEGVRW